MADHLFAVEQYDETGGSGAPLEEFPALPAHVRMAGLIHLPADQVVIAFVEGSDESAVRAAVVGAGWRVDRISPASARASAYQPRTRASQQ